MRDQHGAATEQQVRDAGLSRAEVRRRIEEGSWAQRPGGVIVPVGATIAWQTEASAALLGVGAPAALRSRWGAAAHGLPGQAPPRLPVTVAIPAARQVCALPGVAVRQLRWSDFVDKPRDGLPTLRLEAVVRDLCAELPLPVVLRLLQDLFRERRTTPERLHDALGRGLHGSAGLRAGLRVVSPAHQSYWERLLHSALVRAGHAPVAQYRLETRSGTIAYLDDAWPDVRLGVEVDGFSAHLDRFVGDRRRDRRLSVENDWTIARVAVDELAVDLKGVVAEILGLLKILRERQRPAA